MKIKAQTDNGYLSSYAIVGDLVDSQEYEIDDEFDINSYRCYKLEGDTFIFDPIRAEEIKKERELIGIRNRRQEECFKFVDRPFWIKTLTQEQLTELEVWYNAWLDATETLIIPVAPTWLK